MYSLGVFNPFDNDNQSQITDDIPSNESHAVANLPSLDLIHDHVHQTETISVSNDTQGEQLGPSLDLIDSHPHSHDDHNSSAIETAKRLIIQPSIDFLDAQLHGGEEHIHDHNNNTTDREAADLNDFQRWLKEQNQSDQLNRFLLLQKEMNQFHFDDTNKLSDKLNRTIEELKSAKQRSKYDL